MNKVNTQPNPVRHCMVVHSYYPFDETRVQRQAEALYSNGIEVDLICLRFGDEPETETVDGIKVYRLPVNRNKQRGAFAQLFEYLFFLILASMKISSLHLRNRYQVVQVHNLPDFLVFAALLPKVTGSKVILDLHDLMPEFYCARFDTDLDSRIVKIIQWQEKLSCRFADHVITVTESWRQTLIQRGVGADKCSVVMNVPDARYFNRNHEGQPGRSDGFKFIYHGSITERYGLDLVLKALHSFQDKKLDMRLVVHGRGEYLETIKEMIAELKLDQVVELNSEYISTEDLARIVKSSDAGLVPYRRNIFTDGILPTKLMEYVASGVPAIVSRTPAISEYFSEEMVQFFPPEDVGSLAESMLMFYSTPELLENLAMKSEAFNKEYNWRKISQRYVNLVKYLAGASD